MLNVIVHNAEVDISEFDHVFTKMYTRSVLQVMTNQMPFCRPEFNFNKRNEIFLRADNLLFQVSSIKLTRIEQPM